MEKYIEEGKREKKKKIEGVRRGCEGYRVVLFPVLSTILRTGNKTSYKFRKYVHT